LLLRLSRFFPFHSKMSFQSPVALDGLECGFPQTVPVAIQACVVSEPQDLPKVRPSGILVVLDLDETLVDARSGDAIFIRPHARELLRNLSGAGIDVFLWSAGHREHVERCFLLLDPFQQHIKGACCRGNWLRYPSQKNLALISGVDGLLNRICLVDNSPFSLQPQKEQGIRVPDFLHTNPAAALDNVLPQVQGLLLELHTSLLHGGGSSVSALLLGHPAIAIESGFCQGHGLLRWNQIQILPAKSVLEPVTARTAKVLSDDAVDASGCYTPREVEVSA